MPIHALKNPAFNPRHGVDGKLSTARASRLNALTAQALLLGLIAASALVVAAAHAQTAPLAAAPQAAQTAQTASSNPSASNEAMPAAAAAPKYAARDVERAFGFIDANHDGKISREEAAGFRNVAKYFDAADLNKDNALSPAEFGNALNGGKPQ